MSILQDLYNGFLNPLEDFGNNDFNGYHALSESAQAREKELLSSLSEEQHSLYKKIRNDRSDMQNFELERMFIYAFRMGAEFTLDLFPERNYGLPT